jgi:hypothetical protein
MTTKNGGHFSPPPPNNLGIHINYFSYLLDALSSFVVYVCLFFFLSVRIVPTSLNHLSFSPPHPNFNTWNEEGDTKVSNPQKIIRCEIQTLVFISVGPDPSSLQSSWTYYHQLGIKFAN